MSLPLLSSRTLLATAASLGLALPTAATLDPAGTSCWASSADSSLRERASRSLALPDGRVMLLGSDWVSADEFRQEIYDPATDSWSFTGPMKPTEHAFLAACLLADGRVFACGAGIDDSLPREDQAEIWDAATNEWTEVAPMSHERAGHTATLLGDGRVLVVGGVGQLGTSVEIYDPVLDEWSDAAPTLEPRLEHSATLLDDGRVLVVGSGAIIGTLGAEIFDPATGAWTHTSPANENPLRFLHTATRLLDGRVLITGGSLCNCPGTFAETQLFDPADDSWTLAAPLTFDRRSHTATLLTDGRVLVAGGYRYDDDVGLPVSSTVEIYEPGSNSWLAGPPLIEPRASHTATLLPDGSVLVHGSSPVFDNTTTGEIWSEDSTPPTVVAPPDILVDAATPAGATVALAQLGVPVCEDECSGVATVFVANRPAADFYPIGATILTWNAFDVAGNRGTADQTIVVAGAPEQLDSLASLVESLGLDPVETGLLAKVNAARQSLARERPGTACNQLAAFINEVIALTGVHLTEEEAGELLEAAEQIRAVIGC